MRAHYVVLALLVAGCGEDPVDGSPNPDMTCDPYDTQVLSSVSSTEWPDGLQAALAAYNKLEGSWYVNDCDDSELEHNFAITLETQDKTGVIVGGGPDEGIDCGCHLDPKFPADTKMNPIAVLPTIKISIPPGLEPSKKARSYDLHGVAFSSGQGLLLRSCVTRHIDPADNSDYDDIYWFLRVDSEGNPSMSMLLTRIGVNEPPKECNFTNMRSQY